MKYLIDVDHFHFSKNSEYILHSVKWIKLCFNKYFQSLFVTGPFRACTNTNQWEVHFDDWWRSAATLRGWWWYCNDNLDERRTVFTVRVGHAEYGMLLVRMTEGLLNYWNAMFIMFLCVLRFLPSKQWRNWRQTLIWAEGNPGDRLLHQYPYFRIKTGYLTQLQGDSCWNLLTWRITR